MAVQALTYFRRHGHRLVGAQLVWAQNSLTMFQRARAGNIAKQPARAAPDPARADWLRNGSRTARPR